MKPHGEAVSDDPEAVTIDEEAGVRIVVLAGEHDRVTAPRVAAALAPVDRPLVVDLTGATFIDSSVIAELVEGHVAATATFVVAVTPGSQPARVLTLGGLEPILRVVDGRAAAIGSATNEPS